MRLAGAQGLMTLTDQQIERYSRQIIVPGVGGRAQERLLNSHVAVVAEPRDADGALAYLAGAGVGRIVVHPVGDSAPYGRMIERLRDLNPDAAVGLAVGEASPAPDLTLALIGSARAAEVAAGVCRAFRGRAAVIARLDAPGRIAILPAPPPCALCADAELFGKSAEEIGERAAGAGAVAMVAVAEAFKLLARFTGTPAAVLFEFTGYAAAARPLNRRAAIARCACEPS